MRVLCQILPIFLFFILLCTDDLPQTHDIVAKSGKNAQKDGTLGP
jgi:hypothetical protein